MKEEELKEKLKKEKEPKKQTKSEKTNEKKENKEDLPNISIEEIILIHEFCVVASLKIMVDTTYFTSTVIADQDIFHTEVLAHRLYVLVFSCIYQ